MTKKYHLQKTTILGLTLLAFLLRAYRLDFQSYWIDEVWTIYFTDLSLSELWHLLRTIEAKPPFYYFSLLYWHEIFGVSEYSLRFYALIFGVLTIPLTYRLGQALGDSRLGLLTALLMTVAPYQIWHSQDARLYTLLTATSVLSMWGFVMLWQRGGWRWWLIYIISSEIALLTHYHALLLLGIQGLFLLLTWRQYWRGYLAWGAALLLIVGLYAPWFIITANLIQGYDNWIAPATLGESFRRNIFAYSLNELVPLTQAQWLILPFLLAYGLGLWYAASRCWKRWSGPAMLSFLVAYTIVPHFPIWLYGQLRTPVYLERYMIPLQVGYLLTVALGILAVADRLPTIFRSKGISPFTLSTSLAGLFLLTLVSINGWVLYHHYTDPAYAKPNWRAVIRLIESYSQPPTRDTV
jgi:uncharacterized membrane protein